MALADQIKAFAATDVGQKRTHNEDNFLLDDELGVFIVADGMGGHAAGEVASKMAVDTIHRVLNEHREALLDRAEHGPRSDVSVRQLTGLLEYAVQSASSSIHAEAMRDKKKRGMGTTISMLLVVGANAYVAHVGDSRIYLVRNGLVNQVTEDHTVANELLRLGMVAPDQLDKVPRRNAITRAVGVYQHAEVDTLTLEVLAGDQFILASDGLSGYLDDTGEDMTQFLDPDDGETSVKSMIDFANSKGGKDNITAMLVRVGDAEGTDGARARRLRLKRDMLASMPLFSRLNERELLRVMQAAEVTQYGEGDVVVRQGEPGDQMFVALDGRLEVTRGDALLKELGPGEHLGEMALLRSTLRSATVTALEPSELITFNRRDFFEIIRTEPHIAVKLLWQFLGVLADRLEQTSRDLSEAREEPSEDDEPSTLPPVDSEDRPTPIPEDPFSSPVANVGLQRLQLGISGLGGQLQSVDGVDDAALIESPSFDEAPEFAHRIDDQPSWDSWDAMNAQEQDPETRRRVAEITDELRAQERQSKAAPAPPKKRVSAKDRAKRKTRQMPTKPPQLAPPGSTLPEGHAPSPSPLPPVPPPPPPPDLTPIPPPPPPRRGSQPSMPAIEAPPSDAGSSPSRRPRTKTLESAAPPAPRPRKGKKPATIPDGRLRAARDEALRGSDPGAAPPDGADLPPPPPPSKKGRKRSPKKGARITRKLGNRRDTAAEEFRPTKVTLPLEPTDGLKDELDALRKEFKERLKKSRKERGQKDSD